MSLEGPCAALKRTAPEAKHSADMEIWAGWMPTYVTALEQETACGTDPQARRDTMLSHNPAWVLRVKELDYAIQQATLGSFAEVERLLQRLETPYQGGHGQEELFAAMWGGPTMPVVSPHLNASYMPPLVAPADGEVRVYMDIAINSTVLGRVVLGLRPGDAPKACENFEALCEEKDPNRGYVGQKFFRVIPGFMVQAGLKGRHDKSIFKTKGGKFEDESVELRHLGPGVLGMANSGPNSNKTQFYITTGAAPHLDGKHVVFGQVLEGYGVVAAIERLGSASGDVVPDMDVVIAGCGHI